MVIKIQNSWWSNSHGCYLLYCLDTTLDTSVPSSSQLISKHSSNLNQSHIGGYASNAENKVKDSPIMKINSKYDQSSVNPQIFHCSDCFQSVIVLNEATSQDSLEERTKFNYPQDCPRIFHRSCSPSGSSFLTCLIALSRTGLGGAKEKRKLLSCLD